MAASPAHVCVCRGGWWSYRMSKAALNMATVNMAHELRRRDVYAVALHPGTTDTDLSKPFQANVRRYYSRARVCHCTCASEHACCSCSHLIICPRCAPTSSSPSTTVRVPCSKCSRAWGPTTPVDSLLTMEAVLSSERTVLACIAAMLDRAPGCRAEFQM